MGALSATAQEEKQKVFQPLLEGFDYANLNDLDSVTDKILTDVYFTDENTGLISSGSTSWTQHPQSGQLLRTTDGGNIWINQSKGYFNHLYSVHFPD